MGAGESRLIHQPQKQLWVRAPQFPRTGPGTGLRGASGLVEPASPVASPRCWRHACLLHRGSEKGGGDRGGRAGWAREEPYAGLALWWSRGLHHFLEASFFQALIFLLSLLSWMRGCRSTSGCFILQIKIERSKCWEMGGEGWSGLRWPGPRSAWPPP